MFLSAKKIQIKSGQVGFKWIKILPHTELCNKPKILYYGITKKIVAINQIRGSQLSLRKIEEMTNVYLNSTNFAKHTFLTLVPSSGYSLNLKTLIKLSKVS